MQIILSVAITAVISSLLTLGFTYIFYRIYLRDVLDRKLDESMELAKLKIKQGMREEALELLPKFRAEVKEGFKEALNSAMGGQIVQTMTKPMSSIVESSLSFFLGRPEEPGKD